MTTITYETLQDLLNITIAAASAEAIIDHAINLLNAYGADLANMAGTAGTKSWSGESREAGAIMEVASSIYNNKFLTSGGNSSSFGFQGISSSNTANSSTTGGAGGPESLAQSLARQLSELEVDVGKEVSRLHENRSRRSRYCWGYGTSSPEHSIFIHDLEGWIYMSG